MHLIKLKVLITKLSNLNLCLEVYREDHGFQLSTEF